MKKWILAIIALMPLTASADFMRFEFNGKCTIHCRAIGLDRYDAVSGFIETETGLDNNRVLRARELTNYEFYFGPRISISKATHRAFGAMVLNFDGSGFGGAPFEGITFQRLRDGATIGSIRYGRLSGWIASIRRIGYCGNRPCIKTRRAGGPGGYTRVSEPGALSLFGLGLIAVGIARRRRKV